MGENAFFSHRQIISQLSARNVNRTTTATNDDYVADVELSS